MVRAGSKRHGEDDSPIKAYRYVYQILVGPIPDDHVLHHECGNPGCCNPAHLTPLTQGEHLRAHRG